VAGADDDAGGVVGAVAVGVAVAGVAVGVLLGVGVGVLLGVGVGVVLLGVAVGVLLCVAVGVGAGAVAVAAGGWIGWTRLGAWMRRPVSISAIAAAASPVRRGVASCLHRLRVTARDGNPFVKTRRRLVLLVDQVQARRRAACADLHHHRS